MILDDADNFPNFRGYWGDGDELPEDKGGAGYPWERWCIMLCGQEAGDWADDAEKMKKALKASGYEIVLRNTKTGEESVFPPKEDEKCEGS